MRRLSGLSVGMPRLAGRLVLTEQLVWLHLVWRNRVLVDFAVAWGFTVSVFLEVPVLELEEVAFPVTTVMEAAMVQQGDLDP